MNFTTPPHNSASALITNNFRTMEHFEKTPVGDRDKSPKIQACIELRKKEIKKVKKTSKTRYELVLEVSVMRLKNLPKSQLESSNSKTPLFVKVCLHPDDIIHSTELKTEKENKQKVDMDFVEVFQFPLERETEIEEKSIKFYLSDKKMTRNAQIFANAEILLKDIRLGKPVCGWFKLFWN